MSGIVPHSLAEPLAIVKRFLLRAKRFLLRADAAQDKTEDPST